jgi:hypothetical protein
MSINPLLFGFMVCNATFRTISVVPAKVIAFTAAGLGAVVVMIVW